MPGSFYDVVGVRSDAPQEDIHHAYRLRAQLLHPDRHGGASVEVVTLAEKAMTELNEAYACLSDPAARHRYDEELRRRSNGDAGAGLAHRPPREDECRVCGSHPAIDVTFRQQTGVLIRRRWSTVRGPLCRSCGQAFGRDMTSKTLVVGWWGVISFFANWLYLAGDLLGLAKVASLAQPRREPEVVSPLPAPLPPGRALARRPGPWIGLAIIAGFAVLIATTSSNTSSTGSTQRGTVAVPAGNYTPTAQESQAGLTSDDLKVACQEVAAKGLPAAASEIPNTSLAQAETFLTALVSTHCPSVPTSG